MIEFKDSLGHTIYWYDAADISKYLNIKLDNGRYMGRNKFLQALRFNGYLMKDSNQPTQAMITTGLMRFHMTTKRYKTYGMPLFSDKFIGYIQNRLEDGRFQLQFLKRKEKYFVNPEDVF